MLKRDPLISIIHPHNARKKEYAADHFVGNVLSTILCVEQYFVLQKRIKVCENAKKVEVCGVKMQPLISCTASGSTSKLVMISLEMTGETPEVRSGKRKPRQSLTVIDSHCGIPSGLPTSGLPTSRQS